MNGLAPGERWLVLSDPHANARALRAALERSDEADRVLVLGDLLTYGVEPRETVDLVAELVARRPTDLVLGNHDQLYADLLGGDTRYFDLLPAWLQETSEWTLARVDPAWWTDLPWARRVVRGDILLAHANPWAYRDWRYLHSDADHQAAATTLSAEGFSLGLFGHTHRPRAWQSGVVADRPLRCPVPTAADPLILNPGSVGQPRTRDQQSTRAWLTRAEDTLTFALEPVRYDTDAHVRALAASGMSPGTVHRLLQFFPV